VVSLNTSTECYRYTKPLDKPINNVTKSGAAMGKQMELNNRELTDLLSP